MSDRDDTLTIRSYRNCFRLERRIHRIDRWRIPVPFGIPLRGIGYWAGVELALFVLSRLPLIGIPITALGAPIRYVVLPVLIAVVLTRWEIDGRPAHATLRSLVVMRARPARLVAWRPAPAPGPTTLGPVTIAADDRGSRLRPAVIYGPASVLVRYPFRSRERWRTLRIEQEPGPPAWRGKEITVGSGQRVVIR